MVEEKGMQKYFAPPLTSVEIYQSLSIQTVAWLSYNIDNIIIT